MKPRVAPRGFAFSPPLRTSSLSSPSLLFSLRGFQYPLLLSPAMVLLYPVSSLSVSRHIGWFALISSVPITSHRDPNLSPAIPSWVEQPTWFQSFPLSSSLSLILFWPFHLCPSCSQVQYTLPSCTRFLPRLSLCVGTVRPLVFAPMNHQIRLILECYQAFFFSWSALVFPVLPWRSQRGLRSSPLSCSV